MDATHYVVVYKYAFPTEHNLKEVAKNNATGIKNAVEVVDIHGAEIPASTLLDKVANLINATGLIK